MNKGGLTAIAVVMALSMCFALGCKDDDDVEYLYLDGSMRFDLDYFVEPNSTVVLTPRGVTHPEGEELTYVWTVTPELGSVVTDTTDMFTYTFSDTLQTYTFSCAARADGYVSTTGTTTTQSILGGLDGTGSLTDSIGHAFVNLAQLAATIDEREDRTYYYMGINGYDWFVHNLEYRGRNNSVGIAYLDCDIANDVFGAFYSYSEAVSACPDGWRLPTVEEWDECLDFDSGSLMANVYFNREKMWEFWPVVTISNYSLFSGIPMGDANLVARSFSGFGERAVFWTSDEYEGDSSKGVVKYFIDDQATVYEAIVDKESYGANVRCIRPGKADIPF